MTTSTLAPEELKATVNVSTEAFNITRSDRCDACSAQAYFRVVFESNSELFFCNHHYQKSQAALLKTAKTVYDESAQLTQSTQKTAGTSAFA